ncbi:glycosyltransferase family 2 protein [Butyrivibrio sp. CB08]|uniref:glycosyltransferase family 2 protein n=1 Tax=Butyrivibrio sp. CB08 TaxID=2364879 RepID=UPI000EAA8670|nr:glycosyltransferase family 2 protein [Butyrivibrio sp. CB08]RKM61481.1 glycosyltransferase family 2 protein [Butyrivibrio sp. CB08]
MAKISVIIPVYNTAKYLKECVDSVIAQTFSDIDIYLVDDGSTDGISPKMCDDYAAADSRIKVIHKENGGLQSAWIAGVNACDTQYVFFVDSDDWIDTDMIEQYYAQVSDEYADREIIAGNGMIEKAGERRKAGHGLKAGEYTGASLDDVKRRIQGEENRPVTMSRCMKLTSRKLIVDNIKYCDSKIVMGEDANITIPSVCDCERLVILEGAYSYHYRLVAGSMIHAYNPKLLDNTLLTNRTFRAILKDKHIENADLQMDREFIMLLMIVMKNELRCPDGNTTKRVKEIFLSEDIKAGLRNTDVSFSDKANKLLYFTAKHPNAATISFSKALINLFDKRTN